MHDLAAGGGYWIAVLQIIAIDILLGGDNAVVIALACRRLPERQRNLGIFWGVFGAIGLRVVLIFFALQLLELPYLKLVGGLLLLWIGIKLLQPEDDGHNDIQASTSLLGAIRTIILADALMSLDNVIAIAGAAKGDLTLVVLGILVSVPIIVWGSKLVLRLMDRFPVIITLGGGLLGWIGGEMAVSDRAIEPLVAPWQPVLHYGAAVCGALLIIVIGHSLARRHRAESESDIAGGHSDDGTPRERG